MRDLPELFAIAAILATALAILSIWSPRKLPVKLGALVTSCLFLPVAYAALADLLSKPKPMALEWWHAKAEEATVLGSTMREGEGIYLWLQMAEIQEPRSYVLPWSREMAQQLQDAMDEAQEQDSGVRMRLPFEQSLDPDEPKFYALPQPSLPEKDEVLQSPEMFNGPAQDA